MNNYFPLYWAQAFLKAALLMIFEQGKIRENSVIVSYREGLLVNSQDSMIPNSQSFTSSELAKPMAGTNDFMHKTEQLLFLHQILHIRQQLLPLANTFQFYLYLINLHCKNCIETLANCYVYEELVEEVFKKELISILCLNSHCCHGGKILAHRNFIFSKVKLFVLITTNVCVTKYT